MSYDNSILHAALIGYQSQIEKLRSEMMSIQKQLGRAKGTVSGGEVGGQTRRRLSAAARKRIALAQKKRWAKFRKQRSSSK
jgi:hypothetical protein